MKIKVPRSAAESGTLRVWLRRIPVASDTIYAFRAGPNRSGAEEMGHAHVYGRGEDSDATERVMLLFRFQPSERAEPLREGEELELYVTAPEGDGFIPADLDIVEIR